MKIYKKSYKKDLIQLFFHVEKIQVSGNNKTSPNPYDTMTAISYHTRCVMKAGKVSYKLSDKSVSSSYFKLLLPK